MCKKIAFQGYSSQFSSISKCICCISCFYSTQKLNIWVPGLTAIRYHTLTFIFLHVLFYFTMPEEHRTSFPSAVIFLSPCCVRVVYLSGYFKMPSTFFLDNSISECLFTFSPQVSLNIWYFSKIGKQHYTVKAADTFDFSPSISQQRR